MLNANNQQKLDKLIKESYIEEVQSKVKLLKHIKSGARVLLLENDDNNKVFTIQYLLYCILYKNVI